MGHWFESNLGEYSPGSSVGRATLLKCFLTLVAYISRLDYHPDKMGVAGSSPAVTTNLFKALPPRGYSSDG